MHSDAASLNKTDDLDLDFLSHSPYLDAFDIPDSPRSLSMLPDDFFQIPDSPNPFPVSQNDILPSLDLYTIPDSPDNVPHLLNPYAIPDSPPPSSP